MLTHERLLELVDYNPETGIAFWKKGQRGRRGGGRVGVIMYGSKRSKPYRYFRCAGMPERPYRIPFSHMAFFYMTGFWPTDEIDHKNGDTLDDRWINLRESTREQNEANRGPRKNNKLGLKGVRRTKSGKYTSAIWRRGSREYLGVFNTPQEAHEAYVAAAAVYDGEFLRAA